MKSCNDAVLYKYLLFTQVARVIVLKYKHHFAVLLKMKNQRKWIFAAIFIVCALALGLGLGFGLSGNKEENEGQVFF